MGGLRRHLLATVSAAALSTSALAADMPVKAPPPAVVVSSWAGFYIGFNAGLAWHHAKFTELGDNIPLGLAFPPGTIYWKPSKAGFTGGGQAGYNFQSGNFVYGIEADLNFVSNKASASFPGQFVATVTTSSKLDWMATVRGRLGVTLSPTLIYVTGGWAVAHFEDTWTVSGQTNVARADNVRSGWTVGGGIEHMFARNWTAKIEALYADFGNSHANLTAFGSTYRSRFEHEVVTVRGGLNYKW